MHQNKALQDMYFVREREMDKLCCSVEVYLHPRMKNLLKLPAGQANFPRRA